MFKLSEKLRLLIRSLNLTRSSMCCCPAVHFYKALKIKNGSCAFQRTKESVPFPPTSGTDQRFVCLSLFCFSRQCAKLSELELGFLKIRDFDRKPNHCSWVASRITSSFLRQGCLAVALKADEHKRSLKKRILVWITMGQLLNMFFQAELVGSFGGHTCCSPIIWQLGFAQCITLALISETRAEPITV